jgi:hypothetical protein
VVLEDEAQQPGGTFLVITEAVVAQMQRAMHTGARFIQITPLKQDTSKVSMRIVNKFELRKRMLERQKK